MHLRAWSNVPYFFTRSLEEKNIRVNRVDITENALLATVYKYTVYAILKVFYKDTRHGYFRSGVNYFLTNRSITEASKKFSTSEAFIFLTYSFSIKAPGHKVILFSDWSYQYMIRNFLERDPYWFEKKALQREQAHIQTADLVLSLFPGSMAFNLRHYQNNACHYLGNVINTNGILNVEALEKKKIKSRQLLFIGNKKYLAGAISLIEAFKELRQSDNTTALSIIGLKDEDFPEKIKHVSCYGYLDKGNDAENTLYYELLSNARVIVNTTVGWGAFSAMTEAMYYYTPVITTPYDEFVRTYGEHIDFGCFVRQHSKQELVSALEKLLNSSPHDYKNMMTAAHNKVKDFTWSNYTEKLLGLTS